jgi:putative ABC transport system ATP-binding protein
VYTQKGECGLSSETIIKIEGICKRFNVGSGNVQALRGVDLDVQSTDFVIIYGPSGCGKSTLLNVITGLEEPSSGKIEVRGTNIYNMSDDQRAQFRADKYGIISQMPHWVSALNTWENVAVPLVLQGTTFSKAKDRAFAMLDEVGLKDYTNIHPSKLSGGQQQKVSIARALIRNPWIIVADEPTGNLDSHSSDEVMSLFSHLNKQSKRTIIMVTHNLIYLPYSNHEVAMKDGKVESKSREQIIKEVEREVQTSANK